MKQLKDNATRNWLLLVLALSLFGFVRPHSIETDKQLSVSITITEASSTIVQRRTLTLKIAGHSRNCICAWPHYQNGKLSFGVR